MDKDFLEKINKSLMSEKNNLVTKTRNVDIDTDGDEIDEIQANQIALIASKLSIRDKLKTQQIENALKKITDGTYGTCEECEEDISEKRLEINPHFTMCISCAEQKEFEEKKKRF